MKEIWKDIENFEGLYQVSNLGRVKSLNYRHTDKERILNCVVRGNGYLQVNLYKNGQRKTIKIHRLVAQAFIDNPNNYTEVNHIDENKKNNFIGNLEWCDRRYNMNYGSHNKKVAKALSKTVFQYSLDGALVKEWESTRECKRNGFDSGAVSTCCNNKHNRKGNNIYKGFIWSYVKL